MLSVKPRTHVPEDLLLIETFTPLSAGLLFIAIVPHNCTVLGPGLA